MSLANIRQALETQLNTVTPALPTAWENVPYVPTAGVAYQQAFLLPAAPMNPEIGPGYVEQGIFQVNLFFPKDAGPQAATAQAELIRAAFPFRSAPSANGQTVWIIGTPEIGPARDDDDRFMVPVKVKFQSRVGG